MKKTRRADPLDSFQVRHFIVHLRRTSRVCSPPLNGDGRQQKES